MRYLFVFILLAVAGGGAGFIYARRKDGEAQSPQNTGGVLPPYRANTSSTTNPYTPVDAGTPPPPSTAPVSIYSEPYASLIFNEKIRLAQTPRELGQIRRAKDIPRAAFDAISDVTQREQLLRAFTDATSVSPLDSLAFPFPSALTEQTLKDDLKKAFDFSAANAGLPILLFKALESRNKPYFLRLYNLDLGGLAYAYKLAGTAKFTAFRNFLAQLQQAQSRLNDAVDEKAARNVATQYGYRFSEYP